MKSLILSFSISATILLLLSSTTLGATDLTLIINNIDNGRSLLHTEKNNEGVSILASAATNLETICSQTPTNASASYHLSKAYFYLENDQAAIKNFDRASTLEPQDARPHFFKGLIYGYAKKYGQAEAEFIKACGLAPKDERNWYELDQIKKYYGRPW